MKNTASRESMPRPRLVHPFEQADFARLEHASSLKGLLKPFKGKGELTLWAKQSEVLRDGLMSLAQRLHSQANVYPFNLLPVVLAQQNTGAGTTFLRWRNADRSAMGVALWSNVIANANTPVPLVHELFAIELQRIALNMQISLTHTIARQASQCAEKMAQAEALYLRRIDRQVSHVSKESMS